MIDLKSRVKILSGRAAAAALFACLAWLYIVVFGIGLAMNSPDALAEPLANATIEIHTGNGVRSLSVEIADSPTAQARGLMYRQKLAANTGMLFLYAGPQEITMWMRNTYISLDMVFIKNDGRIHRIARHTEPFSEALINSEGLVTAVLEIAAGEAEALGVKIGDMVTHLHFKN